MAHSLTNDVTLICIDCVDVVRAIKSIEKCLREVPFKNVKFLTSKGTGYKHEVMIPHIGNIDEYSRFCIKDLHKYVDTKFCLIVQHDGWIVDGKKWDDAWFEYDYVGGNAFWTEPGEGGKGGNGGFSLRSRRLVEACSRLLQVGCEDLAISRDNGDPPSQRGKLEAVGMRFATRRVQQTFSIDGSDYSGQFGHHRSMTIDDLEETIEPIRFGDFIITSASYGIGDKWISAMHLIKRAVGGEKICVNNRSVGYDPVFGQVKKFIIKYNWDEGCGFVDFAEDEIILLGVLTKSSSNVNCLVKKITKFPREYVFNGCLLKHDDKRYIFSYMFHDCYMRICWLDNEYNQIGDECFELKAHDPKIIKVGDSYKLSCAYAGYGIHLEYMQTSDLSIDGDIIKLTPHTMRRFLTIFDFPNYIKHREKAWAPFSYKDELYFVYKKMPHQIIKYNNEVECVQYLRDCIFDTSDLSQFGDDIRGHGTACSFNNELMFTTFHVKRYDKYLIGYYFFEKEYPFKPVCYGKELLIDSSKYVDFNEHGGSFRGTCVFPGGHIDGGDVIIMSIGVNDFKNHFIELDKKWLLENTTRFRISPLDLGMTWSRLLSFEITNKCNMSHLHNKCPINNKELYKNSKHNDPLTDDEIVNFSISAYRDHDFNGYVTFWGYNEPLLEIKREIEIIKRIKSIIPNAKFGMITNCLLLSKKVEENDFLLFFDRVILDNYYPEDKERSSLYDKIKETYGSRLTIIIQNNHGLDDRMKCETEESTLNQSLLKNCTTPDYEMIIDYYGNVRLCCIDFKCSIQIANIKDEVPSIVISKWAKAKSIPNKMANHNSNINEIYQVCKACMNFTPRTIRSNRSKTCEPNLF